MHFTHTAKKICSTFLLRECKDSSLAGELTKRAAVITQPSDCIMHLHLILHFVNSVLLIHVFNQKKNSYDCSLRLLTTNCSEYNVGFSPENIERMIDAVIGSVKYIKLNHMIKIGFFLLLCRATNHPSNFITSYKKPLSDTMISDQDLLL